MNSKSSKYIHHGTTTFSRLIYEYLVIITNLQSRIVLKNTLQSHQPVTLLKGSKDTVWRRNNATPGQCSLNFDFQLVLTGCRGEDIIPRNHAQKYDDEDTIIRDPRMHPCLRHKRQSILKSSFFFHHELGQSTLTTGQPNCIVTNLGFESRTFKPDNENCNTSLVVILITTPRIRIAYQHTNFWAKLLNTLLVDKVRIFNYNINWLLRRK